MTSFAPGTPSHPHGFGFQALPWCIPPLRPAYAARGEKVSTPLFSGALCFFAGRSLCVGRKRWAPHHFRKKKHSHFWKSWKFRSSPQSWKRFPIWTLLSTHWPKCCGSRWWKHWSSDGTTGACWCWRQEDELPDEDWSSNCWMYPMGGAPNGLGTGLRGDAAANGDRQAVAVDGGAIVDDGGVDLIRCVQHGGIDLDGDTGHTGSRLDLRTVGVPVQVLRAGVLAVQACFKGIGAAQRGVSPR